MLYLATDHRGLKLKNQLKTWLAAKQIPFEDLGAHSLDSHDDYPDFAKALTQKVLAQPSHRGVIFCGSGVGVCIACNKVKGIRCGLGLNHHQVTSATQHDHINILAVAADYTSKFKCFQLVKRFLEAEYSQEERHVRRVAKIET